MLKNFKNADRLSKEKYSAEAERLKAEMAALQLEIKEKKLPVIVLFEGVSASGKGQSISRTILSLDPRFFETYSITAPSDLERRMPDMWRYWTKTPARGQICFLDRSWYQDLFHRALKSDNLLNDKHFKEKLDSVENFERLLVSDGALIVKIYLNISKKEQRRRLKKLSEKKSTSWRVGKKDWDKNKKYEETVFVMCSILKNTNYNFAPWYVVDGTYKRNRNIEIYKVIINSVKMALENKFQSIEKQTQNRFINRQFKLVDMPKIKDVNLDKYVDRAKYKERLDELQKELFKLQNVLYNKKIPMVVAFEGCDAAGKGGAIKRVAGGLDSRSYSVNPVAAPTELELSHHYLWRFWNKMPKNGHISIFDRTWYGRVMVERIEKFTSQSEWQRAYNEINAFEQELFQGGMIVAKFWLQVSKDVQLKRFQDRQNTPSKRWKITDEDWRNREKWDEYQMAVDEMIQKTSTEFAPWNIVPSKDKLFARIYILDALNNIIKKHLKKLEDK